MMQDVVARRHGGLGIASFLIGLVSLLIDIGVLVAATYLAARGQPTQQELMIIGGILLLTLVACLLGVGLGIAGAASKTSKKGFPVFGIILCVLVVLIVAGLMALGARQGG
jgi:hypothetical protein